MQQLPCPLCGDSENAKFSSESAWCVPCTEGELLMQRVEDSPKQPREYIN